jgi:hypothetical protein
VIRQEPNRSTLCFSPIILPRSRGGCPFVPRRITEAGLLSHDCNARFSHPSTPPVRSAQIPVISPLPGAAHNGSRIWQRRQLGFVSAAGEIDNVSHAFQPEGR